MKSIIQKNVQLRLIFSAFCWTEWALWTPPELQQKYTQQKLKEKERNWTVKWHYTYLLHACGSCNFPTAAVGNPVKPIYASMLSVCSYLWFWKPVCLPHHSLISSQREKAKGCSHVEAVFWRIKGSPGQTVADKTGPIPSEQPWLISNHRLGEATCSPLSFCRFLLAVFYFLLNISISSLAFPSSPPSLLLSVRLHLPAPLPSQREHTW